MNFKFKKERFIYAGTSAFDLQEGTIVKVVKSPGHDDGGILVRTGDNKKPFKQLVATKTSSGIGSYWGDNLSKYSFEVLKDKKESDYFNT